MPPQPPDTQVAKVKPPPALTPLQELSEAADPSEVTSKAGQAALLEVVRRMRRLPIGNAWPRGFQLLGLAYCELAGDRCIIGDEMGVGKGQVESAKVLTPTGWIQMRDVRTGTRVIGSDGCPYTVTGVFPRGVLPVYRVTFSDGASMLCDDDHLWAVNSALRKWRGAPNKVLALRELRSRPLVDAAGNAKWYIPVVSPVHYADGTRRAVDPYLLGYILGNGGLSMAGRVTISAPDIETVERLKLLLPPTCTLSPPADPKCIDYRVKGTLLRDQLASYDLMGKLSTEKRIPHEYLFAPLHARVELLQGLLDSDGYPYSRGKNIEYTSSSPQLAGDMRELVRSLGGTTSLTPRPDPTYTSKGEKRTGQTSYRLNIVLPPNIQPFRLRRKATACPPRVKYHPTRALVSIEPAGHENVICIAVDAQDQLYVTDDYIVTHNTSQAICRVMLGHHFPALVICPSSTLGNWRKEWAKWFPGVPTYLLNKANKHVPAPGWQGVVLTTWDMLRHHVTALVHLKPRIVVSDEAHAVTYNPNSQRSQVHALLAAAAPHLLLLTGTPIKNGAVELWRLLCLIDPRWESREEAFKNISKDDLLKRDAGPLSLAVRNYMLRRMKAKALKGELSSKVYRFIDVEPSPTAMLRYRYLEKRFRTWLQGEMERRLNEEMAGQDDETIKDEIARRVQKTLEAESLVKMGYLRRATGRMKVRPAAEWILDMQELGEPVVVFAEHQKVLHGIMRLLDKKNAPYVVIEGSTGKRARDKAIERFQDGDVNIFLATQAAKEGINLVRAQHLLVVERWWNPAIEDQATDRIHRIGQLGNACIWLMRIKGTADERMAVINTNKRVIFRRMVNREVVKKPS